MLSVPVIITGMLLAALKPVERWQAMRNLHHSDNFMLDRRFILAGLTAIAILTILLVWINYRNRRRASVKITPTFNSFARRSGLNVEEQNLVLLLADVTGIKQPDLFFTSIAAFDRASESLLMREKGDGRSGYEQEEIVSKLSQLREKLGFSPPKPVPVGTMMLSRQGGSRQIPVGKMLQITRRKTVGMARIEARLIRNEDVGFTLELPDVLKIEPGEVWNLQYYFGPSVWEFDARLLGVDGRQLVFGHSDDVRFISRRRFLRVKVHKDAFIARFPFESGQDMNLPQFVRGKLVEIAGPGLLIEASLQMKVGERVLAVVQAADDKVIQNIGEVRHIRSEEDGYAIAIELVGVEEANIDELVRLTNAAASQAKEPVKVG
jgi:hypothetical protein